MPELPDVTVYLEALETRRFGVPAIFGLSICATRLS
jgi:hypothetical protein